MRGYSLLAAFALTFSNPASAEVERFTAQTFKPKRGEFTGTPKVGAPTHPAIPSPVRVGPTARQKTSDQRLPPLGRAE